MTGKGGAGSMGGGSKEFLTMDNMALGVVRSSCALSSLDGDWDQGASHPSQFKPL